ncbi:hypothetical protein Bca52824_042126 [Brassica carinata]|uniref:Uncharacterized protein n=1 Tax=Brassica carinata TaxID=52824 RepID=A0A8X7UYG2_BRACI|nr:hypothetical protein Bca52824_042126 [Brassica carinata]
MGKELSSVLRTSEVHEIRQVRKNPHCSVYRTMLEKAFEVCSSRNYLTKISNYLSRRYGEPPYHIERGYTLGNLKEE